MSEISRICNGGNHPACASPHPRMSFPKKGAEIKISHIGDDDDDDAAGNLKKKTPLPPEFSP